MLLLFVLLTVSVSGCARSRQTGSFQSLSKSITNSTVKNAESIEATEPVEPGPTGVITLQEALGLALVRNPELRVSYWLVRASDAERLQASLRPNPELEIEVEEVGGSGERSGFDGAETTVQIAQPIELGQKRAKRTALADLEKDLAQFDYESKRLDVRAEVTKAFVEVLAAQQRLQLTEELLKLSRELSDTVGKRVDAGKDSPLEKTKAAVAVSDSKLRHEQAVRDLQFARRQLVSTWGSEIPIFERAAGPLDCLEPIAPVETLADLTEQNLDGAESGHRSVVGGGRKGKGRVGTGKSQSHLRYHFKRRISKIWGN